MKTKLRRIHVDNNEYKYSINNKYYSKDSTNILTVKVYLDGSKNSPLIIEFLTLDHHSMGQILESGVNLENTITNTIETLNIHEPKRIRELILKGRTNGWTGYNKMQIQNGINYLNELGFKTNDIEPLN